MDASTPLARCARCKHPIRISGESAEDGVARLSPMASRAGTPSVQASFVLVPPRAPTPGDAGDESPPRSGVGHQLAQLERIHALLAETHPGAPELPMCAACAARLSDVTKKALREAAEEVEAYRAFVQQPPPEPPSADDERELAAELAALERELADLEAEGTGLAAEVRELEAESARLDAEEAEYWLEHNAFLRSLAAFQAERDALNTRYDHVTRNLQKLKRTNVVNDVFRIWHDGSYGTINGFRLGKQPSQPVNWAEINAGWGQACLLLDVLARKMNFEFNGYRLIPMGSFSKIQKLAPRSSDNSSAELEVIVTYDLQATGGSDFGASTWSRILSPGRFDTAVQAFIACISQLGAHCERLDDTFHLPYAMHGDRIGDMYIKTTGTDENWTRVCKYVLTNLKWLLAFVTRHSDRTPTT